MAGNKNSGRKKNQSYKRTTNNEIERDRREEQREAQERRVRPRIDPNFFAARQPQPTPAAAANAPQDSGGASPNPNPPPDPDPPAQDRIDPDHPNPTHENPLPGVDMTRVPELFRLPIGQVFHKLRSNMKKGQRQGNQHGPGVARSSLFPWKNFVHEWEDPRLITGRPATFVYYLLPYYGRI